MSPALPSGQLGIVEGLAAKPPWRTFVRLLRFSMSANAVARYLPSPCLRSLALKQESGDAPAAGKPRGEEGGAWRGRGRSSAVMATTAVLPDPRRCCKAEDAPVPQRSRIGPPAQPESRWGPRCPRQREGARRAACSQTCRPAWGGCRPSLTPLLQRLKNKRMGGFEHKKS